MNKGLSRFVVDVVGFFYIFIIHKGIVFLFLYFLILIL